MVHVKPNRIVGFRPKTSEALPQMIAVVHCAREKTADVIPAQLPTFFLGTPKLSIISGCHVMSAERNRSWDIEGRTKYGKTDVKATGSANLHIAKNDQLKFWSDTAKEGV